ncbi:hypothetical protein Taro_031213, partial [Colocasia esculenta]|nr:hypothetical protein [Colocasia esculenta]
MAEGDFSYPLVDAMAEEISTPQSQSDNIEIVAESNTQVSSRATTSCHPEHAKKRKLRSTVWNDFDRILKEDGSPIALGTIPLAPNLDAEIVVDEDVILQAPSLQEKAEIATD